VTLALIRRRLIWLFLPLTAAGLAVGYQEIQVRLERPETRHFLEAKAREILGTEVKIGRLSYLPPAGLSLEEIQLSPKEEPSGPSLASIKRLVFGYGPQFDSPRLSDPDHLPGGFAAGSTSFRPIAPAFYGFHFWFSFECGTGEACDRKRGISLSLGNGRKRTRSLQSSIGREARRARADSIKVEIQA